MELKIQYAKRSDGAKTAIGTMGSGSYVVIPPGAESHLEWWGNDNKGRAFIERLAEQHTVVLYDRHGFGLSDRDRTDFSLEDDVLDLEAVVDAIGMSKFALFGSSNGGYFAIAYTLRHPEPVTRLVLYGTGAGYTRGQYAEREEVAEAMAKLRRANRELYTQTLARVFFPTGADLETLESFSDHVKVASNPDLEDRLGDTLLDLRPELHRISQQALVLHRRGDQVIPFEAGRELAGLLPNASFLPLEGDMHFPGYGDVESVLRPVLEFLAEDAGHAGPSSLPEGTAVILFADIAGSTALTEQLGDAAFRARARKLDTALRAAIKEEGGTPVEGKVMGDGVMATFPSARQAIGGAVRCSALGDAAGLPLHLGIHAGDVIREENTVYGGAVNIASRITEAAPPGEILVSDTVRGLARTSVEAGFDDRGEHELQGVAEPQRLYAVRWREEG